MRAVEDDTLVLSIGTAPLARLLSEQSNTEVIAESLHAVLGVRWRVRCEHGEPGGPPAPHRPGARPPPPPAPPHRRAARPARRPPGAPPRPTTACRCPRNRPDEDAPPEDDEEAMLAEAAAGADAPIRRIGGTRRRPRSSC